MSGRQAFARGWRCRRWLAALVAGVAVVGACGGGDDDQTTPDLSHGPPGAVMEFESPAFASGESIPAEYTCDGDNLSPPLRWEGVPDIAETLAVEVLDRDAGGFVHWIIFDIPANAGGLTPDLPTGVELDNGSKQAINTFGETGYGGPCPPPGEEHEYVFRLYALDAELGLDGGGSARNVQEALAQHTLALSEIATVYGR